MSNRTSKVFFFSFLLLQVFASNIICQESSANPIKRIHVKMEGSDSFGEFGYSIIKSFEKAFKEYDILTGTDTISNIEMELSIQEIDSTKAAVSVIILERMPEKVIDLAAKAEVLYVELSEEQKAKLPDNGKFIREYASSEYLKQFRMLVNNYLEIINKDEADQFASRVVKDSAEYIKSFRK